MSPATLQQEPSGSQSRRPRDGELVEYDEFIARQIGKTGRQVKLVEIAVAAAQLVALLLIYSLVVVLLDHWLIAGGLGFVGRVAAFAGLVAGSAGFFGWRLIPLFSRRVNPVYAAHSIEQAQPSLKNSIVNFLLLRRRRAALPPPIYEAIERRAAKDLAEAPVDAAVDRSHLVKTGYVLLALVVLFCLYKLFSPKDPLQTLGRMAAPWANLPPATRVTIADVQPGSTRVFQGESVRITALVSGLRAGEPVTLYYSTADGQAVDLPVVMRLPEGDYLHEVTLPPDASGLEQTIEYYLAAGDAKSDRYRIETVTAPAILVDRVEYQYPAYAEVPPRIVERQGDLQGIEGTKVTIEARANVPIESAYIDFNSDGGRDLPLSVEGKAAKGSFLLGLKDDRPLFDSYQIRFLDAAGRENPQPVRHTVEVLPDQPPAIEITAPAKDVVEVPLNGSLPIALRAADRDFKLRRVTLFFARDGQPLHGDVLLDEAWSGTYPGAYVFQPNKLPGELKVGDQLEYWGEARDNRAPTANRTETVRYRIRLVDRLSDSEAKRQHEQAQQAAEEAQRQAQNPADKPRETAEDRSGQRSADDATRGEPAEAPREQNRDSSEPPDPQRNPAEAMEKILEHQRDKQEPSARSEPPRTEEPSAAAPDQSTGDEQPAPQSRRDESSGSDKAEGSEGSDGQEEQSSGASQQPGGEKQSAEQQRGQQRGGTQGGQSAQEEGTTDGQGKANSRGGAQPGGGESKSSQPAAAGESAAEPDSAAESTGQGQAQPQGTGRPQAKRPGAAEGEGRRQKREGQAAQQREGRDISPAKDKQLAEDDTAGERHGDSARDGSKQQPSQLTDRDQEGRRGAQPGRGDRSEEPGGLKDPRQPSRQPPQEDARGGDPNAQKGNSGAGQSSQKNHPTPEAQGANQARSKQSAQNPTRPEENQNTEEGSSPSISNKESSSQGGESGDRSGGGKQGGGQKANAPGTGSAGQNTDSEQGGGQSQSAGDGESSTSAGDKAAGDQPREGQGSQTSGAGRAGQSGSPGGQSSAPMGGKAGSADERGSGASDGGGARDARDAEEPTDGDARQPEAGSTEPVQGRSDSAEGGEAKGRVSAGGPPEGESAEGSNNKEAATQADPVNLEHARKATELVLESLKDQLNRNAVDPELLDKLKWTPEDLRKFVERWDELRKAANENEHAREQFEQTLSRLNLKRRGVAIQQQGGRGDDRNLRETRWANPPPEYLEQFRAYTEGASKANRTP
jgi:hypothetical protein